MEKLLLTLTEAPYLITYNYSTQTETGTGYYKARAIDVYENKYTVTWAILENKHEYAEQLRCDVDKFKVICHDDNITLDNRSVALVWE